VVDLLTRAILMLRCASLKEPMVTGHRFRSDERVCLRNRWKFCVVSNMSIEERTFEITKKFIELLK
jgi:hypothetical protein